MQDIMTYAYLDVPSKTYTITGKTCQKWLDLCAVHVD